MSNLNYHLVEPPAVEPISLSLAKKQLRIDGINHDDNYLLTEQIIPAARAYCENHCNIAFYDQTYLLTLDSFPYGDYRSTVPIDQRSPWNYSAYWADLAIRLPKPRTVAINSLTYVDSTFNLQTISPIDPTNIGAGGYYADLNSEPARIVPGPGGTWPITQFYEPGSIQVNYTAATFAFTKTETVSLAAGAPVNGITPYTGVPSKQVISIQSVKDSVTGATLNYSVAPILDANSDPINRSRITIEATVAPTNLVAVVTYRAGVCPPEVNQAIQLMIGHLYEHREEIADTTQMKQLPLGVKSLLKRHRFNVFGNFGSGY